ncbi:uncharacterized protein LOC131619356 [Vicia villosa]|uniref:uncharacterized protein LOC131619356 n=1 Tax=Vicia villosa TaxID=3911 RepID=UPI00273AB29C|nr:uncharacterized protein LOC131619356 [Vicia villosa]
MSIDQCPSIGVERAYMNNISYAYIVGFLIYAMVCTRPDVAYAFLQEGHYYCQNGSTSQTNVSYAMPKKDLLEFVLDVLQRSGLDELFAKPINPNVCKSLDFATIRDKINKEHYMSMDAFKFDVYRLCFNAMYYNDKDSGHYRVAEALLSLAKRVFEDISVPSLQRFHSESLTKKTPGEIPQVKKMKSIGHARFRHTLPENKIGTPSTELEREKRSLLPNIPETEITPQVVEPSLVQTAKTLDNEQFFTLCLGNSSSYVSNNVSKTKLNPQASGINIPKQVNSITGLTSLLSCQDRRECNKNGGGRKHNSSITIPLSLDKNMDSSSKDIGAGASSSQMGVWPSKASNFARTSNSANNFFCSQPNQYGYFQGLAHPMGPFPMLQHSISSSGPIPSSNNIMRGNINPSKGEGKKKDGEGTSTNDGEIAELDLDLKL